MKPRLTVFTIITLILMLSACNTLPLPGSPTESLFVMSGSVDRTFKSNDGSNRTVERILLTLENMETEKKKQFTFSPGKSFTALPLEPGKYRIFSKVSIEINNGRGSWIEEKFVNFSPFLIEESTVFISPMVLVLKKRSREWFNISTYSSATNNDSTRRKAVEEVFSDRRYKAWENYQVIGWEIEEE